MLVDINRHKDFKEILMEWQNNDNFAMWDISVYCGDEADKLTSSKDFVGSYAGNVDMGETWTDNFVFELYGGRGLYKNLDETVFSSSFKRGFMKIRRREMIAIFVCDDDDIIIKHRLEIRPMYHL